jgi:hypothetical protein
MRPATVRGALYRGPRNRPALAPDPMGKPIHGVLVEVDPGRLVVMDLVETAGQDLVHRAPVLASYSLRSTTAEAWVLPPGRRLPGWRKLGTDRWAGVR